MNISLKSMKAIYWLVTLSFWLSMILLIQLKPESYTWRLATVQTLYYIAIFSLYLYVLKLFTKAILAESSTQERRFKSRIKTQLWGLLIRTASGVVGIGIVALLLPLDPGGILVVLAVYAVVVILGFINDGKRYDERHI